MRPSAASVRTRRLANSRRRKDVLPRLVVFLAMSVGAIVPCSIFDWLYRVKGPESSPEGLKCSRPSCKCVAENAIFAADGLMDDFQKRLLATASRISDALDALLVQQARQGEIARPARLMAAMRHGALNGGKRLRPFLVLESAALFGVGEDDAMPAALALECVHCYSLIHDDLPAMDDDDLRRGQPTVHKAYDEATAILAGDGLLTLAFELLGDEACQRDAIIRSELVVELAKAAGLGGMVGGQMLDLQAAEDAPDETAIRTLQAMKTGALLRFACEAGALLGGASTADRAILRTFGEKIGQAFQLADDILDVVSDEAAMGKRVGKDEAMGKGTLVAILGLEEARRRADELADEAEALLAGFGERANVLKDCARFIVSREQ